MSYGTPHDAMTDSGYGSIKPRFHVPRSKNPVYPYIDPDIEEEYDDDESEVAITSKIDFPFVGDTFATKDPFYFVAGNTKLSDCFERPDQVLAEIHAMGSSMSPIPNLYKNKGPGLGGSSGASFVPGVGSFKRTGSKKGYFSPPPDVNFDGEEIINDDSEDQPVVNMKALAKKTTRLKENFSVGNSIFNV